KVARENPGPVLPDKRPPDAERKEGAGRVATRQVESERRLVRRRGEPVQVPAVLHDLIRDREPGGGVVELDVAGEADGARDHDRCSEGGEHGERRRDRPAVELPPLPGWREAKARYGEGDDQRNRKLSRSV